MDTQIKWKLSAAFAIAVLMCPQAAFSEENVDSGGLALYPVHSQDTEIFYGRAPERLNGQQISFVIDGKHLGFWEKLDFRYGDTKDYAAVIFEGSARDRERLCPYFSLLSRPYTVEQLEKDELIFAVHSIATDQETDAIEKSGCMVTDKPDMSKIVYKK